MPRARVTDYDSLTVTFHSTKSNTPMTGYTRTTSVVRTGAWVYGRHHQSHRHERDRAAPRDTGLVLASLIACRLKRGPSCAPTRASPSWNCSSPWWSSNCRLLGRRHELSRHPVAHLPARLGRDGRPPKHELRRRQSRQPARARRLNTVDKHPMLKKAAPQTASLVPTRTT